MMGYQPERRSEETKLATQKYVTYLILAIFSSVTFAVMSASDQAERSTIMQTVINITLLAVGFWLGSSSGSKSTSDSIARIAEAAAPSTAAAVAAQKFPTGLIQPELQVKDVKIAAENVDVTETHAPPQPPKEPPP